jgi:endonuclease YncB( thermonuclease family)
MFADLPQCRRIPAFRLEPMMGWRGGVVFAAFAAAACGAFGAAAQDRAQPAVSCGGEVFARGAASRIIDGRTFVLDDGREVRLAGVEVPQLSGGPGAARDEKGVREALARLLGGTQIVLKQAEPQKTDRYGRLLAYAFVAHDGAERLVQADLVALGVARVAARAGSRPCALELLAREAAARRAKLGLWSTSYYECLDAENPAAVLAEQGRFALAEGKVVSVGESGATIYVNLGGGGLPTSPLRSRSEMSVASRRRDSNRRSSPATASGFADGSRNAAGRGSRRRALNKLRLPTASDGRGLSRWVKR